MTDQYRELEASELFCPKCKKAQPVKKRMLLVLSDGDKYDYLCAECGEPIGAKMDKKTDNFDAIIK